MVDVVANNLDFTLSKSRRTEIRRGEYVDGVAIQEGAIPGSTLHGDTDNAFTISSNNNVNRIESTGTFNSSLFTVTTTNGGSAGHLSGEMFVRTNGTANGTCRSQSIQTHRQMSGTTQKYTIVVRLSDLGVTNNVRRWGLFDDQNGFGYQLDGTVFSLFTRKAGVDTVIPYGTWNGPFDTSTITGSPDLPIDLMKMQQYDILFGGLSCRWLINGRNVHSFGTNTLTSPLTEALTLPFRQESMNTGGLASDRAIFSRGQSFRRLGPSQTTPRYKMINTATTTLVKMGSGTLIGLVINNPGPGGTISLFDNIVGSGTLIAVLTLGGSTNSPFSLSYNLEFITGLTIVTSAAVNITAAVD